MSNTDFEFELAAERERLDALYRKLDAEHENAVRQLDETLRDATANDPEAHWRRQSSAERLGSRVHALRVADHGLCFGRVDDTDGTATYVGRIGLFDEENGHEPLLIDWRAPAARPFYCATAASPEGIVRRRHFRTRGRELVSFHDDALCGGDPESGGDAALLAALDAPREGAMRDIVATIQTEQDAVIRLSDRGVLVIEGGPGTGKTAVALHRVAYLLYTHRERLARRGVLVIGPNTGFLDYIGHVLPALGETSVVFATAGDLFPGLRVTAQDSARAERVKGSLAMVDVLAAAVADRQEMPSEPLTIELDDVEITVDDHLTVPVRDRARATGLPHNDAREHFRHHLIEALVDRAVELAGEGWLDDGDVTLRDELSADFRVELETHPQVHSVLDRLWPYLTPSSMLAELFSSPERIVAATPGMDERDRAALHRVDGALWTVSDVPLLDESADLLGADRGARRHAERRRREHAEYARGVLEILDSGAEDETEGVRGVDLVDAEALSERHIERDERDLAVRAAEDRDWTYGHVVVDEAQELSAMDWRVVMRRCPSKSMTVVGDLAQRQSVAGSSTWTAMLNEYVPQRWTYQALSINYRTPAEIMAVANRVLALVDLSSNPPESVRATGVPPRSQAVPPDRIAAAASEALTDAAREGTGAVVVPDGVELDIDALLLTPHQSKGMEFDVVVVVEPQHILNHGERGAAELYVALTRATQQVILLHSEPLPEVLRVAATPPRAGEVC